MNYGIRIADYQGKANPMDDTENILEWVRYLEEHYGEHVESIVFGEIDGYRQPKYKPIPPVGKVMSLDEAMPYIDVTFDNDWGGHGCPPFAAYTSNWIMSVYSYDGQINFFFIRRNPIDGYVPYMHGT